MAAPGDHYMQSWDNDERYGDCITCGPVRVYGFKGRVRCSTAVRASQARRYSPERNRAQKFKKNYGITMSDWDEMNESQAGMCAICNQVEKLHVDHDHATGAVRQLLCTNCNTAIGLMKEDAERLRAAARYVEYWATAPLTSSYLD